MDPNISLLVGGGTVGLIAFMAYVIKILWEAHKEHDADVLRQRDAANARVDRLSDVLEPILEKAEKAP